jgi:colanic acid biosynthesis protein WcaH
MTQAAAAISDSWLSPDAFTGACGALPLVSIDLMITRPCKDGEELLLGLRNNRPAQHWWFTPGGRIRKNEPLLEAMARIAVSELNLNTTLLQRVALLGAWDHFYADSAFSATVSTHYVNLAYWLRLDKVEAESIQAPAGPEQQHAKWQWMAINVAAHAPLVHRHVRVVAKMLAQRDAT